MLGSSKIGIICFPKLVCWNANPQRWWYSEVGPLELIGSWDLCLHKWDYHLYERGSREIHRLFYHARTEEKIDSLQPWKSQFPAPWTVRIKFLLFTSHSVLWCFVIAPKGTKIRPLLNFCPSMVLAPQKLVAWVTLQYLEPVIHLLFLFIYCICSY